MARTLKERFEAKVDRNGPVPSHCPELGSCHVWKGSDDGCDGYGRLHYEGAMHGAHRVAFFLANGRWPFPQACHRCDNPRCANADHIFEGTNAENMADRNAKGRTVAPSGDKHGFRLHPECVPRGEKHGMSKLSDQDVRDIRANYALCRVTLKELGERYGVHFSQISNIVRGKSRVTA